MSTGIRYFHSEKYDRNYLLVKNKENKAVLYEINNDGTKTKLMNKKYEDFQIKRKAKFVRDSNKFERPTERFSIVPRLNKLKNGILGRFIINEKGDAENLNFSMSGLIDRKGKIDSLDSFYTSKPQVFNIEDCNARPMSKLAKRFLKKLGTVLSKI